MKMNGKILDKPKVEVIVFPRQGGNLVFKAQAVLDYTPFMAICPRPQPKTVTRPGKLPEVLISDPEYVSSINAWAPKQTDWMILESLKATPELEWETVKEGDPETWGNYTKELKTAGFSDFEITKLIDTVITACGMNQEKIDEATKSFLAGQEGQAEN